MAAQSSPTTSAPSAAQELLDLEVRLQLTHQIRLTLLEFLQLDFYHLQREAIPIAQREVDRLLPVQRGEPAIDRREARLAVN